MEPHIEQTTDITNWVFAKNMIFQNQVWYNSAILAPQYQEKCLFYYVIII